IEELGSIGKNNRQAFKSLLIQLLAHLLKLVYWQTEREYNANQWEAEIINFRVQIADLLEDSPSLKPYLLEIFDSCYGKARQIVSKLSKQEIPIEVIITPAETLAENWFP
ncbi:MAG: DUF29 domain-containing protein, partial [Microcystis panniformis]